jgi:hypothetical protein
VQRNLTARPISVEKGGETYGREEEGEEEGWQEEGFKKKEGIKKEGLQAQISQAKDRQEDHSSDATAHGRSQHVAAWR